MRKGLIRLFAFFGKEVSEVRRQPRLVLSLILGPFLILLLFGAGYQGERPNLRTALVVPQDLLDDPQLEAMTESISANFNVVNVSADRAAAMDLLMRGEVEVVEIMPDDIQEQVLRGQQAPVEFKYNEINPLNEQWIQYLGYAQVNELNKTILRTETEQFKQEAGTARQELSQTREQFDTLSTGLASADPQEVQQSVRRLRDATVVLAASPLLASQLGSSGNDPAQTQQQLLELQEDLETIDRSIDNGSLEQQRTRIEAARQRMEQLDQVLVRLVEVPTEVIVSPLEQQYQNLYGNPPDFMTYYAPSVLALIIQHIAVTLGALSLVRERLLGAIEFYGVAPVWLTQVLVGKYLAYTLFVGLIVAVLVALMLVLAVPFYGSLLLFAGVTVLFALASLGVGFLISSLSTSDSQAVQLSMLVLLLSIFFSGFFLPLENFSEYVQPVGYVLPLTHGINSFQSIMLRGTAPGDFEWLALGSIAAVTFAVVLIVWRAQFRRIA